MNPIKLLRKNLSCLAISKKITTLSSISAPHQVSLQVLEAEQAHAQASLHSISLDPFYAMLCSCKNKPSIQRAHAFLIVHGEVGSCLYQNRLVRLYGMVGQVESARKVFDAVPDPDLGTCKVMIRWYFINDLYRGVIGFYDCMRVCVRESDNVVFSIVLKACSELRDLGVGKKVHCHVVKAGNPDSFVLNGLVDVYAKCGEVSSSRRVFDEIVDRDVICWTSMIVAYVQNGCAEQGLSVFNRMRSGLVEGNVYTFGSLVTACTKMGALHQGKWIHGYMVKYGIVLNSYLVTALVDMYSKCGSITDAHRIFDECCIIDLVSWTSMIVGYTQQGYPEQALKLFTDKKWEGILPNSVTLASVISACRQADNSKFGRLVHGFGLKLGLQDANVSSALVGMYAKCDMMEDANNLFQTISEKDVITWNSIMSGYAQNGYAYEALKLFQHMRLLNLRPDAVALVTVLSVCASVAALHFGYALHAHSIKVGLLSCNNVYIGTALLSFYAKCGDAASARHIFDGMEEKNEFTWNAVIGGYGMQGDCSVSLTLFDDMLKDKMEPNDITFTTILSACSHAGMVDEGKRYFSLMCQKYNFRPSLEHYACMVDLLSRAGRLEEAQDFIEKMPIQPDVTVLGAFLHGCNLHSGYNLGELALGKLLEMNPNDASYYVLMSQLYASDGKWSQAYQVRELMKARELNKSAALSLVDMQNLKSELPPMRLASQA
ncbi:hypothetical protein ACET3Z_031863 [Daucus carota]